MKSIQIAIAAAALLAVGLSQASEITEFPVPASSTVSRAEVRAEAQAASKAGLLRYDFTGPASMPSVEPMSHKTREEVRKEAAARTKEDALRASYFVGGM